MDLTEAEDIKKRWHEYTEELYKKDLHNPENHNGVIIHLEPDMLECEVKWVLRSITRSKASGGDGIPVELFQILKDDAVKVLHSLCKQIWKTQQWPQDWERSVFIPIPKKGNAKECSDCHTTALGFFTTRATWEAGRGLGLTTRLSHQGPSCTCGDGPCSVTAGLPGTGRVEGGPQLCGGLLDL